IADGLGAPMTGDLVLEHVRALVDDIVTVTDEAIAHAMSAILARARLLVEPAGAAGYAAIASGAVDVAGRTTAAILSGANVDLDRLTSLIGIPGMLGFATFAFTSLLAIVNPVGAVPLYIAMTGAYDEQHRRATLRRAIITALVMLVAFSTLGTLIMRFFGITTQAFQIAGGIIFF